MAREVEEIDVVIGGHSHTFLFTGENPPSIEKSEGPYPTYIEQASGKNLFRWYHVRTYFCNASKL